MAEEIARTEVKLILDDREYTTKVKKAEKAMDALDASAEELQGGLNDAGKAAGKAGKDLEDMGKKATTTRGALSKLRSEAKYLMSFGGMAGLLGGGAVGALVSSALGASAANAANMQQMGLAAGGNQSMFRAMNDLYRQINSSSPISTKDSAYIAAQVTKRFGFLSGSERSQLADRLSAAVESGDDAGLIMKSLEKIAKSYGMNKAGKFNAPEMLNMLNYTANQTGESLSTVAATTAALAKAGKTNKIDVGTMQQLLMQGYQQGNDMPQTAESILRGIETTNAANAQRRPSSRIPAWMGVSQTEFAGTAMPSVGYLNPYTGLVPTEVASMHREADMARKSAGMALGDFGDMMTVAFAKWYDWRMQGGLNRGAYQQFQNFQNQSAMSGGITINQYFSSSDSPTVSARKAAENEAANWARR